jgi:serine/threonine protein kinase
MVHRDIKPANIFICRYGRETDFVKVLDFGLVKRVGRQLPQEPELTDVGSFAGTPTYAAPEAIVGDRDAVDPRSDIYSLGCVAYWLLTGHTVFEAPSSLAMLVQHVREKPDAPSRHSEFEVPRELDDLILRCLEKDKTQRPASAEDLDARLTAIRFEQPWTRQRARDWWDLHVPASGLLELDAEFAK